MRLYPCPSTLCLAVPLFHPCARKAGFDLGMRNGMVVAVPNPSPMSGGAGIDAAVHSALEQAEARGLKGRDITPFVLASVNETTGGHSLKSNVALVRRNRVQRTRAACYRCAANCGRLCAVWAYLGWLEPAREYGELRVVEQHASLPGKVWFDRHSHGYCRRHNPVKCCAHDERHRLTSFPSLGSRGSKPVNENPEAVCVENDRPHHRSALDNCSLHFQSRSLFF